MVVFSDRKGIFLLWVHHQANTDCTEMSKTQVLLNPPFELARFHSIHMVLVRVAIKWRFWEDFWVEFFFSQTCPSDFCVSS